MRSGSVPNAASASATYDMRSFGNERIVSNSRGVNESEDSQDATIGLRSAGKGCNGAKVSLRNEEKDVDRNMPCFIDVMIAMPRFVSYKSLCFRMEVRSGFKKPNTHLFNSTLSQISSSVHSSFADPVLDETSPLLPRSQAEAERS